MISSIKTIYVVTANGRLSSEGYETLEGAKDFILRQAKLVRPSYDTQAQWRDEVLGAGYSILEREGVRYEIHDVTVKSYK